jgi:hypothetical protein
MKPITPKVLLKDLRELIEAARQLVEANRKLIAIYERKIQDKLAEIWEE